MIQKGDKVEYTYDHHLNRRSSVQITKNGTVIRVIRPKKMFTSDWAIPTHAVVQLDGNKKPSIVLISKLVQIS